MGVYVHSSGFLFAVQHHTQWKATVFFCKLKTRKNCFRYLKLMSPLNAAICTTISYTLWAEWYYLKNNCWTLRSKVKVPWRSLRYVTHRLMVMHPHTKYHWPISKDKNVIAQTRKYYLKNNYLTLRSKSHEGHYGMRHTALWSCTHILELTHLKNNYLTFRSKSHEGHYGTRHAALWSCIHIPNITDLSWKTKMLLLGQENTI
jgi:hypothetical protein